MNQIVILDGFASNPGDVSWAPIEKFGELTVFDRTSSEETLERCAEADIVLTNKTILDRDTLEALQRTKFIGVLATGYNVVDVIAAAGKEIPVCNVPAYSTPAVAQHVFALILEMTNHVGHHAAATRSGRWSSSVEWCFWDYPIIELRDKTLGIIGFGSIGQSVAQIARAFGMRVLVTTRSKPTDGTEPVPFKSLLQESDIVTVHAPLTSSTELLFDSSAFGLMKPGAFFINTSRGGIVNEADLATALNAGSIGGAAVDVLSTEPPAPENPLLSARNCLVTPHQGWASMESRTRLIGVMADNIRCFLEGSPINVVGI